MPNFRSESFGVGDQTWLGSTHGIRNARTAVLTVSAFTPVDGVIKSGTPVDAADEGAVVPFTGAEGERLGFVLTDQAVGADAKINAPILRHGIVKVDNLPVEFEIPASSPGEFSFVGGSVAGGSGNP